MDYKKERTCACINNYEDENLIFHKGREYQVDLFPLYYQVYQNGGWEDYIFMNEEEFQKYFKLIE